MLHRLQESVPFIGAVIAFFSGLALSDWASLAGILFGAISVVITYKKYKHEIELKQRAIAIQEKEVAYKMLMAKIDAIKHGVPANELA
ncbi:holin [Aggregatibacter actinomycetemcomitans]|uniref:HP1 family phage holin n=1 Tax=Aggregatibacter actinomycetemcomitans TaxID=714 RepID=UPI00197BA978|nr:HP1 family phage holin [Aggregatibacter actinomycetemcomitans]MBN6067874.1 holin [Aggregatibacter actinomycetemcomitans]MBN6085811.1 holin [Aggregatibacter actinomycetemcomitans]